MEQGIAVIVQPFQSGLAGGQGCVHILYAAALDFPGISVHGKQGDDQGKAEKQYKGGNRQIAEYFMEIYIFPADDRLNV